jgi:hypothetical protein
MVYKKQISSEEGGLTKKLALKILNYAIVFVLITQGFCNNKDKERSLTENVSNEILNVIENKNTGKNVDYLKCYYSQGSYLLEQIKSNPGLTQKIVTDTLLDPGFLAYLKKQHEIPLDRELTTDELFKAVYDKYLYDYSRRIYNDILAGGGPYHRASNMLTPTKQDQVFSQIKAKILNDKLTFREILKEDIFVQYIQDTANKKSVVEYICSEHGAYWYDADPSVRSALDKSDSSIYELSETILNFKYPQSDPNIKSLEPRTTLVAKEKNGPHILTISGVMAKKTNYKVNLSRATIKAIKNYDNPEIVFYNEKTTELIIRFGSWPVLERIYEKYNIPEEDKLIMNILARYDNPTNGIWALKPDGQNKSAEIIRTLEKYCYTDQPLSHKEQGIVDNIGNWSYEGNFVYAAILNMLTELNNAGYSQDAKREICDKLYGSATIKTNIDLRTKNAIEKFNSYKIFYDKGNGELVISGLSSNELLSLFKKNPTISIKDKKIIKDLYDESRSTGLSRSGGLSLYCLDEEISELIKKASDKRERMLLENEEQKQDSLRKIIRLLTGAMLAVGSLYGGKKYYSNRIHAKLSEIEEQIHEIENAEYPFLKEELAKLSVNQVILLKKLKEIKPTNELNALQNALKLSQNSLCALLNNIDREEKYLKFFEEFLQKYARLSDLLVLSRNDLTDLANAEEINAILLNKTQEILENNKKLEELKKQRTAQLKKIKGAKELTVDLAKTSSNEIIHTFANVIISEREELLNNIAQFLENKKFFTLTKFFKQQETIYISDAHLHGRNDMQLMKEFLRILSKKGLRNFHLIIDLPQEKEKHPEFKKNLIEVLVNFAERQGLKLTFHICPAKTIHDRTMETDMGTMQTGRSIGQITKINEDRVPSMQITYVPKKNRKKLAKTGKPTNRLLNEYLSREIDGWIEQ